MANGVIHNFAAKRIDMTTFEKKEYAMFSRLFLEALKTQDFTLVENLLSDDIVQIVYGTKEFTGKHEVISYWKGWLVRWNEPSEDTEYTVKYCKYYDREVLSINPSKGRELYQISRIENGKIRQLVLCPNPLQNPIIRYWDLNQPPLLFGNLTIMPNKMGKSLEPRPYRIPCMRCGCKSECLQLYEYTHETGPLGYRGELSVCSNCCEAVEFLPTVLIRY